MKLLPITHEPKTRNLHGLSWQRIETIEQVTLDEFCDSLTETEEDLTLQEGGIELLCLIVQLVTAAGSLRVWLLSDDDGLALLHQGLQLSVTSSGLLDASKLAWLIDRQVSHRINTMNA